MYESVVGLNDGGVAEFRSFFLFQNGYLPPLDAIGRNRQVEQSASPPTRLA